MPYDLTKFVTEGWPSEQHGLECASGNHLELFIKQPVEVEFADSYPYWQTGLTR